jgi:hypothetical protein
VGVALVVLIKANAAVVVMMMMMEVVSSGSGRECEAREIRLIDIRYN